MALLLSDKRDFKLKKVYKRHYILIKYLIYQEDIIVIKNAHWAAEPQNILSKNSQ